MDQKRKECIITLTTDFGLKDPWAGSMKGVILSINPSARVVDITHLAGPENIMEGAYLLAAAYSYFPEGTIHVAVVDPGVGTERAPVFLETEKFYFVGPDNGIFSPVVEREKIKRAVRLTRKEYFREGVSATFHGRDIFAPVAAHLSLGVDPASFGEPLASPPCKLKLPRPEKSENAVIGEVLYIDNFGNLITNIGAGVVSALKETGPLEVFIRGVGIVGISKTYGDAVKGSAIAVIGSSGLLEVACFRAMASEVIGAGVGERVEVRVIKR